MSVLRAPLSYNLSTSVTECTSSVNPECISNQLSTSRPPWLSAMCYLCFDLFDLFQPFTSAQTSPHIHASTSSDEHAFVSVSLMSRLFAERLFIFRLYLVYIHFAVCLQSRGSLFKSSLKLHLAKSSAESRVSASD